MRYVSLKNLPCWSLIHKNKKGTEVHEKPGQGCGLTVSWLWLIGDSIIGNLVTVFQFPPICPTSHPRDAAEVCCLHLLFHLLFLFLLPNYEIRSIKRSNFAICYNYSKFFFIIRKRSVMWHGSTGREQIIHTNNLIVWGLIHTYIQYIKEKYKWYFRCYEFTTTLFQSLQEVTKEKYKP